MLIGYKIPVSTDIRDEWLSQPIPPAHRAASGTNPLAASNVVEFAAWSCSRRQARPTAEDESA